MLNIRDFTNEWDQFATKQKSSQNKNSNDLSEIGNKTAIDKIEFDPIKLISIYMNKF